MECFIVLFVTRQSNIHILPHAGKPENLNNEASKFYITGADEYSKYLVEISVVSIQSNVVTSQWTVNLQRLH